MAEMEVQDLIIIKRRANTEPESPKGGVWKIAFADFMTAMMCFFLVMWLINAANEDTRQAVASYFNPVRLTDLNRKGLQDPRIAPDNQPTSGERTLDESEAGVSPGKVEKEARRSHDALFEDPYRVLSEIAQEGRGQGAESGTTPLSDVERMVSETAFRDPFDPNFEPHRANATGPAAFEAASAGSPPAGWPEIELGMSSAPAEIPAAPQDSAVPLEASVPAKEAQHILSQSGIGEAAPADPAARQDSAQMTPEAPAGDGAEPSSARAALETEINEAVRGEVPIDHAPSIGVEETGGGLLISLTDDADFGMFDVGSAEPQPEMVRIMERIAAILRTRGGTITIRGHTDARPYRSGTYDNWRLSTDRAQMAYYMLVRGGLDDGRVAGIEGYADRQLKVPTDPDAAENRRIEIFLREVGA